jgi:hypothetical protein
MTCLTGIVWRLERAPAVARALLRGLLRMLRVVRLPLCSVASLLFLPLPFLPFPFLSRPSLLLGLLWLLIARIGLMLVVSRLALAAVRLLLLLLLAILLAVLLAA